MQQYAYKGRDRNGRSVSGKIGASSDGEARAKLRIMGIAASSVKGGAGAGSSSSGGGKDAEGGAGGLNFNIDFRKLGLNFLAPRVSTGDLAVFTKQLSVMIDAGLSIVQTLDMLANQSANPRLKEVLHGVREKVEGGLDLPAAMEKYPDVFDSLFCSLVRAGSASGQLDVMLRKLSIYIEKSNKLKKQLISALSYPAIIVVLALVMTVGMLLFVVPMFAKNYTEAGKELPALTQMVIDASEFLQHNFVYIIVAVIMAAIGFRQWKKTPQGQWQWDSILLRLPVFGNLIAKISIARFSATMSTLISSGIAIIEALDVCAKATGNQVIEKDLMFVKEEVAKGKGLANPMSKSNWFPPMVVGMVSIGEASGGLDGMLEKVASLYEEDVDAAMAAALKMIEPAMFVLIGGIVGFILLAMYLPIFDLASTTM